MTPVTMPEPVAYLRSDELRKLGEPYSDSPLNQRTDSMLLHAKGTAKAAKQYGHDVSVITTTQAEAYKDACVREALEMAAQEIELCYSKNGSQDDFQRRAAEAIRALIPPIKNEAEE